MTSWANWVLLIVQVIGTAITGIIGFLLKRELNKADKTEKKVNELELKVAEEYVRKDDFNRTSGEILAKIDKIYDMLFKMDKKG